MIDHDSQHGGKDAAEQRGDVVACLQTPEDVVAQAHAAHGRDQGSRADDKNRGGPDAGFTEELEEGRRVRPERERDHQRDRRERARPAERLERDPDRFSSRSSSLLPRIWL